MSAADPRQCRAYPYCGGEPRCPMCVLVSVLAQPIENTTPAEQASTKEHT
jgi:hypothetical protein